MAAPPPEPHLRRSLTLWPLIFYGLSVIVGAGIYVAIGTVVDRAGPAAPVSFLLAGLVAGATGLCYAELAGRFPEAAGAAAYVRHGFGQPWLSLATGIALALAIVVSTASIASGAVHYLALLLPLPPGTLTAGLVLLFTGIAALGVRESVGLAAGIGAIEIVGLLVAVAVGTAAAGGYDWSSLIPSGATAWSGVLSGAFIAFFAFIGFESLANMGEEVRDPHRTLPRGIVGAIVASVALYLAVSLATVASGLGSGSLLGLFQGMGATAFALVGTLAVANGVLVQVVVLSRLIFGVARQGQLPSVLAYVNPRTRTPLAATALAGAMVLAMALFLPFERLLALANLITLAIFVLVDLALWRVQRRHPPRPGAFAVPRMLPPLAAGLSALLIAAEVWP